MKKWYFPISRWNLMVREGLPSVVRAGSYATAAAAEAAGKAAEATYKDQKFERVFYGTYEEFYTLVKRNGK